MTTENFDYFAELVAHRLAAILETAAESGFTLPLHLATIGANGAMMYCRYDFASDESLECTVIWKYVPENDDGLKAPVNIVLVDSKGEAMQIVLHPFPKN